MVKVGVLCQLMWLHEEPNCGWCARSGKTLKVVVCHEPTVYRGLVGTAKANRNV
jgi:hypothetical protein